MTMIKSDLRGKKLLLIGGLNTTADLIKLAHRNGVKIGVADYNKNTYVKGLADYAHDISVVDENSVIELFKYLRSPFFPAATYKFRFVSINML